MCSYLTRKTIIGDNVKFCKCLLSVYMRCLECQWGFFPSCESLQHGGLCASRFVSNVTNCGDVLCLTSREKEKRDQRGNACFPAAIT